MMMFNILTHDNVVNLAQWAFKHKIPRAHMFDKIEEQNRQRMVKLREERQQHNKRVTNNYGIK